MKISKWTHYAVGVKTREDAIDKMYTTYDAHPGHRRLPSREAFEVYRVKRTPLGAWILFVRRK